MKTGVPAIPPPKNGGQTNAKMASQNPVGPLGAKEKNSFPKEDLAGKKPKKTGIKTGKGKIEKRVLYFGFPAEYLQETKKLLVGLGWENGIGKTLWGGGKKRKATGQKTKKRDRPWPFKGPKMGGLVCPPP